MGKSKPPSVGLWTHEALYQLQLPGVLLNDEKHPSYKTDPMLL